MQVTVMQGSKKRPPQGRGVGVQAGYGPGGWLTFQAGICLTVASKGTPRVIVHAPIVHRGRVIFCNTLESNLF
jgi:hypothetical protein